MALTFPLSLAVTPASSVPGEGCEGVPESCDDLPTWRCVWVRAPQSDDPAQAGQRLRGRILVPAGAQAPLDIRARVAGRIYLASLGEATMPDAGFEFVIELSGPGGDQRVSIEAWEQGRGWREFYSTDIGVGGAEPRVLTRQQPPTSAGDQLLRQLHAIKKYPAQAGQAARLVAEMESAWGPWAVPVAPWWGHLECGEDSAAAYIVGHGLISLGGWVAHEQQAVRRVDAWVHPWLPARLEGGWPRPDVAEVFPALVEAGTSGFSGQVAVPLSLPQPWNLTIVATLADGTRQRVFARRIKGPALSEGVHDQLPVYSRKTLWRALRDLRPVAGGWRGIWRQRRAVWAAARLYREEAAIDECSLPIDFWRAPVNRDAAACRLSVVMVNDNLTLGGAAWFAYEYASYLRSILGWHVHLIAPVDGPMRAIALAAGFRVSVAAPEREGNLEDSALDWRKADLVIVNTLVAHWAIPLARRWRKPSLLYLHEGSRLNRLCGAQTTVALTQASSRAIAEATRVVLLTCWTYVCHAPHQRAGNFRLLRSWVDLQRLDLYAAQHHPGDLRRRHGIGERSFVFACLGSICERKGQRVLLHAVQWLRRGHAAIDDLVVLLVGAQATPDVARLREEIERLQLTEIRLVDETPQALEFLHLADAYVCPSYEEGFPRAVMEAAALRKWIVATAIPGNREMLSDQEAWLVPAGDPPALAEAMAQVRAAARARDRSRPEAARWRMERWYDDNQSLPVHAALAAETAALGKGNGGGEEGA